MSAMNSRNLSSFYSLSSKNDKHDIQLLLDSLIEKDSFHSIIGRSKNMLRIYKFLQQVSGVDTTILITGEAGTGKELIVEALHSMSPRCKAPLIKVNCLNLTDELLDGEMFGSTPEAFAWTGANRSGLVEAALGGTLFLDEIGGISPRIQLKLLSFLQQKEYKRVGGSRTREADVRIVAATNADLGRKVEEGGFRKDLYFRLKVLNIHVPPLRERAEDIPFFVDYFCKVFAKKFEKTSLKTGHETMSIFMRYSWPGNVRELKRALEHGALLCSGTKIEPEHLPRELFKQTVQKQTPPLDREGLIRALKAAQGRKCEAARMLGVSRRTIYRMIHQHGLMTELR